MGNLSMIMLPTDARFGGFGMSKANTDSDAKKARGAIWPRTALVSMVEEEKRPPDSQQPLSTGEFVSLDSDAAAGGPIKSVEGWILLITGIHEEAEEDIIIETFGRYGLVRNLHLNLDRRTGYLKGYALLEYENLQEAESAIAGMNGKTLLGKTIHCDFAYRKPGRSRR